MMGKQNYFIRLVCTIAIAVAMSGCATVSLMPDTSDMEGKRFSPPPDKANIYVTRTSVLGGAFLFQIYLDGKLAGSIAPNTYLLFEVEPGRHQVVVITQESQRAAIVSANRGENYFLNVVPMTGWAHPQGDLETLTQEEGENAVRHSKRAELLLFTP